MTEDFRMRMNWAIERAINNPDSLLVISGGATRVGFPTEAEAGAALVPLVLVPRVLLEERSQSTRQNVRFVKELLHDEDITTDSMVVVCISGQLERARYLFRKIWPELSGVPGRLLLRAIGRQSPWEWLVNKVAFLLTVIDPNEKIFLPIRKRIFTGSFK